MAKKILEVPYISQWDVEANFARNDCGPTCVAMILRYYGIKKGVNDVYKLIGVSGDQLIGLRELQTVSKQLGVGLDLEVGKNIDNIKTIIEKGIPLICLIHYDYIPKQDRWVGGHFVVVCGYDGDNIIVHDPDHWSSRRDEGKFKRCKVSDFERAWGECWRESNLNNQWLKPESKPKADPVVLPGSSAHTVDLFAKCPKCATCFKMKVEHTGEVVKCP